MVLEGPEKVSGFAPIGNKQNHITNGPINQFS